MAQETGLWIKLKAMFDKKQVQEEAENLVDTAQQIADKKDISMDLKIDRANLEKELEKARQQVKQFKERGDEEMELKARLNIQDLEAKLKTTKDWIKQIDDEIKELEKQNLKPVSDGVKKIWDEAKDADKKTSWLGASLKSLFTKWVLIAGATKLWQEILELGKNAELARISFTTMLWSAEEAENLLKNLSDFAKKTPFELVGIRESAKQLLAMGVSANDMIPTLKALGDVSAWLNVPLERLALNYGQVLTQGKLTWKELKDFTTAWVPLLDELAKNLNKTKTEVQDMISKGQVLSSDMVKAFETMTAEGGKFANLMEAQANTLEGQRSNLKDTLAWIGEQIGLAIIPMLTDMVELTAGATDEFNEMGESGFTAAEGVAWGIQVIGNGIRGLIKLIQSFWVFLGTLFSSIWTLGSWVFKDFQTVAENLVGNSKEIFSAVGNNIKVGILKGVNSAIEWLNKLLEWADNKIGVNLGRVWSITAWEYQTVFGQDIFRNTKNAVEGINLAWDDAMDDMGQSWFDFANKITKEQDNIKKTFRWTSKELTKTNKSALQNMVEDITWAGSWSWGGWKSVKWAYEQLQETAVDTWNDMDSLVKDHQKQYDTLVKNIEKVETEYGKLLGKADDTWHTLEKSLRKYNEELNKNQTDSLEKLGQRYIEVREERSKLGNSRIKGWIGEISDREWKLMREDGWTYKGYTYEQLKEYKELYDELRVIEENTTKEQREAYEFTTKISRAQEIINDMKQKEAEIEQKKADAIEKQKIAVALMNQEIWKSNIMTLTKDGEDVGTWFYDIEEDKREQIHNVDNIEYAKQLEEQSAELSKQYELLQQEKDAEVEILIDATARKIELEESYTKVYEESIAKQKKGLDDLIAKTDTLIAKRREYLSMGSWGSHNAYWGSVLEGKVSVVGENGPETIIARQSSYVQPRNAGNSYNTVNNSNNLSINGLEFGNFDTVDDLLDALKEKLTYRN